MVLGRCDHETFLCLRVLEDGQVGGRARQELLKGGLERAPDLALLHQLHGKALATMGQEMLAGQAYRRGLACAEEPDIRTRLLVDLATAVCSGNERKRLLEEAIALNGNLVAAATARLVLHLGE
jgi:hypothetical protein